ncbi:MAG: tyrosine-type recombinase/integrase [Rhizobiales bacterium]|nr:tyrosine-type recombinase/integrase [Hyphomicrobiales bacterium]
MAKQPLATAKDPPIRFTDAAVKKLTADPARRREIRDQQTQGLVLRITPQGQKSWSVLYRIAGEGEDGKRGPLKRVTLGEYPLIGLADARIRALQVLEIADTGQEPGATRERASAPAIRGQIQAKQDERLVRHVVERFATVYARPNLVNAREIERLLQTYVVTAWGDRRIDTITRADAHNLIDEFVAQGEISRGREVRKHLTRVFNWAVDRDIIRANPLSGMERPEIAYKPRERTLTMAEMRAIWEATPAMGYPFGPIVRMLILSGQRKSEIAEARWTWVRTDMNALEVPSDYYKTKRPQVVPLTSAMSELLASLPRFTRDDFLFTTNGGAKPVSGFSKAKQRLDKLSGVTDWTIHDIRRTVATEMARLGIAQEIIERVLGHVIPGVAGVYNRYSYLDQKRTALETWGKLWEDGQPSATLMKPVRNRA